MSIDREDKGKCVQLYYLQQGPIHKLANHFSKIGETFCQCLQFFVRVFGVFREFVYIEKKVQQQTAKRQQKKSLAFILQPLFISQPTHSLQDFLFSSSAFYFILLQHPTLHTFFFPFAVNCCRFGQQQNKTWRKRRQINKDKQAETKKSQRKKAKGSCVLKQQQKKKESKNSSNSKTH